MKLTNKQITLLKVSIYAHIDILKDYNDKFKNIPIHQGIVENNKDKIEELIKLHDTLQYDFTQNHS